MYLFISQ